MAKFCERCKHAMSAHDNHASCPQCRVSAGDCSVDPGNPCTICEGWTRKQWAKLRRSLIDARARMEHRGKQHWTVACPPVEAWILAKPASTSASEISSQAGEGDFVDERLVDTPKQHEVQVLVVQSQNGANMATSSTLTAAGASNTADNTAACTASTAACQEPIVVQLGQATQASPRKAERTVSPAQDLEAFKADMTSMLSDMLQSSFQKFASQFNTNPGGQGKDSQEDTVPKQVYSEPTVEVASDDDIENSPHRGPQDQSEGEVTDGEADPVNSGLPTLEQLKMSKEEQQDYDAFSLASVSVPTRPWRATGDSRSSQSQPPDNTNVSQARPQAIAQAQSIKSSSSDQRSVQHHADQRQVQLRAPQDQASFPVLVPQGQGHRPVPGRPVVRRDDLDSLLDEEFSVDLDNEAVLKEKQARSEVLDKIAEFCNLNRQDPRVQKEVMGMRLPAYNAPTKKSIEVSLPWHSTTADIANLNNDIVRGKLNKSLKSLNPSKPWSPKEFFGASGYYVHNTHGYLAKPESLDFPSRAPLLSARRRTNLFSMCLGTLKSLAHEWILLQGLRHSRPLSYKIKRPCHAKVQLQLAQHCLLQNT